MHNTDESTDNQPAVLAMPTQISASQQEVLERLHNLSAFSEQLILLCGPPGAGKSVILEAFLEQASDYANLAYLPNSQRVQPEALRRRLLQQLVQLDAYAADDTLTEALQRNLKSGTQHVIIVIDNAEHLPPAMLSEFQELMAHTQTTGPQQRFSVILAGPPEWAVRVKKGLSLGSSEDPALVVIKPFAAAEKAWFARSLLNTQPEQVSDHKLRDILTSLTGYPGEIQQAMQQLVAPVNTERYQSQEAESEGKTEPNPTTGRSLWSATHLKVLAIVAVAALVSLLSTLFMHRDAIQTRLNPPAQQSDVVVMDEPGEATETEQEEQTSPPTLVQDYSSALNRLQQSAEEAEPARDITFQLVRPLQHINATESEHTDEAEEAEVLDPWLQHYDNQRLWQTDPTQYVIQLAAFTSETGLQQFLNSQEFPADIAVYHTERNGSPWYVVTLGQFGSAEAARAFIADADALSPLQPWPKSVAAVQAELAVVVQ